jgi:hypothetical protein
VVGQGYCDDGHSAIIAIFATLINRHCLCGNAACLSGTKLPHLNNEVVFRHAGWSLLTIDMSDSSSPYCIAANPDISGIGVRTAVYAQNLIGFIPVVKVIADGKVTEDELLDIGRQSTTILLTAFAILISAIVQVYTDGLSNFHAAAILNLSWINNTNLSLYVLLLLHRHFWPSKDSAPRYKGRSNWRDLLKPARIIASLKKHWVVALGSLHLSLMAAIGIWLWVRPGSFGDSLPCSLSQNIMVLGRQVPFSSTSLRKWSIFVYALLIPPGLNLFPMIIFALPFFLCKQYLFHNQHHKSKVKLIPVGLGLLFLVVVIIIFITDTELAIRKKSDLREPGDAKWTFGQVLAMMLLILPIWEAWNAISSYHDSLHGPERLVAASNSYLGNEANRTTPGDAEAKKVAKLIRPKTELGDQGGIYGKLLVKAATCGHEKLVERLLQNSDVQKQISGTKHSHCCIQLNITPAV